MAGGTGAVIFDRFFRVQKIDTQGDKKESDQEGQVQDSLMVSHNGSFALNVYMMLLPKVNILLEPVTSTVLEAAPEAAGRKMREIPYSCSVQKKGALDKVTANLCVRVPGHIVHDRNARRNC